MIDKLLLEKQKLENENIKLNCAKNCLFMCDTKINNKNVAVIIEQAINNNKKRIQELDIAIERAGE